MTINIADRLYLEGNCALEGDDRQSFDQSLPCWADRSSCNHAFHEPPQPRPARLGQGSRLTKIHWRSPRGSHSPRGIVGAALWLGLAVAATVSVATTRESLFLAENDAAMERMMVGMHIKPSGDIDQEFAAMMIPHHQGAIDMAVAELRYGSNEQLRRIAQEIIVSQQQEIAAMRLALGQPLPSPAPAPTQVPLSMPSQPLDHAHHSPQ